MGLTGWLTFNFRMFAVEVFNNTVIEHVLKS